jgi:hypothetical protein
MQKLHISPDSGFRVVAGSALSQRAIMVLAPGQSTRGPYNRHASSDQWLLVLAGNRRSDHRRSDGRAGCEHIAARRGRGSPVLMGTLRFAHPTRYALNVYAPPAF